MQRRPRPCVFPCGCVKQETVGSEVRAGRCWTGEETGVCTSHLVGDCSLAWSRGHSLSAGERAALSDIPDTVNKLCLAHACFTHTDAWGRLAPCRRVHFKRALEWDKTFLINLFHCGSSSKTKPEWGVVFRLRCECVTCPGPLDSTYYALTVLRNFCTLRSSFYQNHSSSEHD